MNEPISIIIPNWNGEKLLEKCLGSLESLDYKEKEIIIVDNNSTDSSEILVKTKFPNVKFIKLDWNSGFSHAVNVGINQSSGSIIALLNNDTEVDKYWLINALAAFSTNPQIGIVTSKLINYFDRNIIDAAGDEMNIVGQAKSRGHGDLISTGWNKGEFVFLATGGASLYKREIFSKVGLLEETYYMYFEDADLSYRCQKKGYLVWYEPSAVVYHMHRASSNKRKKLLEYLLYRNFAIFYLINTPRELFFRRNSLLKFILVFLHTYYYLAKEGNIIPASKAFFWILINPIKLIKLRRERSHQTVSNDYIESFRTNKNLKILNISF